MKYSASTSCRPEGWDYEVFLSFRGPDTRTGFTDYLYNDLIEAGIRAFRDNEGLRVGEEIGPELLRAIESSKISIPIFSSGYASSKWCLMELAHILQCKKSFGQMIFPIFYDVEPWDVRHQGGSYEAAFEDHEKLYDETKVKQWRETLDEVGKLKGLELKKIADGHEGKLVKMVVEQIWSDLKKSNSINVSDSLVGIDYHVKKMEKLLDINSGGVRMIGIHGMSGIGKTTVARVIYNHFLERFKYCCFVAGVRECSQRNGLVDLQNILIGSILKHRNLSVTTVDQGINVISETFSKTKVLIVLDDVDKREQLDALARKHAWFGSGSRIIITAINREILDAHRVDRIYQPKEMNPDQALQLLCKHAFSCNHPPEHFLELSRAVAYTMGGLPLALEVTGSFLREKSKEVWKSTLKKLESIPEGQVQERLRLSYDALSHEQKQIFLDIACFFDGKDKRDVFHMWDGCGFHPDHSIVVLTLRSLVKVGEDDKLIMHDQLRKLGREIVRQENSSRPEKRSRLWSHDDSLKVIQGCQKAKNVEVLCLNFLHLFRVGSSNTCLTNDEFEKLPNLRYLEILCADLGGDFKGLLQNLRWLKWNNAMHDVIPKNLDLANLSILDLCHSELGNDWAGWNQLKVAKKLKVLNLSHCQLSRSPDFSAYKNLEDLNLGYCRYLVNIHPSIRDLEYLKRLNISGTSISKLPNSIGMLKNLEELYAQSCFHLEGEVNIGKLNCLRITDFSDSGISHLLYNKLGDDWAGWNQLKVANKLKVLNLSRCQLHRSSRFSAHKNLEDLNLGWCRYLLDIHPSIGDLKYLKRLNIFGTSISKLPESIGMLKNLEGLHASSRFHLEGEVNIGKLNCLRIIDFHGSNISSLPMSMLQLHQLKTLDLSGTPALQALPELPTRLSELNATCKVATSCSNLSELKQLEVLSLGLWEELLRLPKEICTFSRLHDLSIVCCAKLQFIPRLPTNLAKLIVRNCRELLEIKGLENLELLKHLSVEECEKLSSLDGLENSKALRFLSVIRCSSITRLPNSSSFTELESFEIRDNGTDLFVNIFVSPRAMAAATSPQKFLLSPAWVDTSDQAGAPRGVNYKSVPGSTPREDNLGLV